MRFNRVRKVTSSKYQSGQPVRSVEILKENLVKVSHLGMFVFSQVKTLNVKVQKPLITVFLHGGFMLSVQPVVR